MKMNKQVFIPVFLLSIVLLLASTVSAETTEMKDTSIDYTSYRELVVNEPGVIYLIKIVNTGDENRTYEIIPDASVIRNIGTYRIDPSDTLEIEAGDEETFYLYLAIEKSMSGRTIIPIIIKSGSAETSIQLVARVIGPFVQEKQRTSSLTNAFKIVLSIILVIIIILALIFGFRRITKKKEEEGDEGEKPEFGEDIDTYY